MFGEARDGGGAGVGRDSGSGGYAFGLRLRSVTGSRCLGLARSLARSLADSLALSLSLARALARSGGRDDVKKWRERGVGGGVGRGMVGRLGWAGLRSPLFWLVLSYRRGLSHTREIAPSRALFLNADTCLHASDTGADTCRDRPRRPRSNRYLQYHISLQSHSHGCAPLFQA